MTPEPGTDPAGGTAAERPLRKDAARNRERLGQAGREVFAERGLEASLDDIARHAGLGVGTAYRHFGNKFELAQAIFASKVEDVVALLAEASALEDPWAGIVHFLEGAAAAQAADRGLRETLMGVYDAGHIERVHERMSEPLTRLVDRARAAGAVRQDADASDIGMVVLMVCTVADVAADVSPDLWRRYLPMLLDGLRPGRTSPVEPIGEDAMRKALSEYYQRQVRTSAG